MLNAYQCCLTCIIVGGCTYQQEHYIGNDREIPWSATKPSIFPAPIGLSIGLHAWPIYWLYVYEPVYLQIWLLILCLPCTSNICWASGKVPRLFCTWRASNYLFWNVSICSTIPHMCFIFHLDAHTRYMLCERNTIDTSWGTWHEGQWTTSSAYIS